MISSEHDSTRFITGLRGYSALGVFLIHSGGLGFREYSEFANRVVDHGKYGVVAFFIISAFTICGSIDRTPNFSFKNYLVRRVFRIIPLYFIVIFVAFLLGGVPYYLTLFGVKNDLWNLFAHLSFLSLVDYRYQNTLIGVEWTIPIEFFYYLILPFLFFTQKRTPYLMATILILAALISVNAYNLYEKNVAKEKDIINLIYHLSVFKYAFCFAFGVLIYRVRNSFPPNLTGSFVIVLWIIVLVNYIAGEYPYPDFFYTLWVGLLVLFCMSRPTVSKILFENPVVVHLGEISFSFYLIHYLVIQHLFPTPTVYEQYMMLGIVIAISSVTYFAIERPFIALGKRLTIKKSTAPQSIEESL